MLRYDLFDYRGDGRNVASARNDDGDDENNDDDDDVM